MASQIQLDFGGGDEGAFAAWERETAERRRRLALRHGFPIGHAVEVELRCGQVLRGRLRLREPGGGKTLELEVDGVVFPPEDAVCWLAM